MHDLIVWAKFLNVVRINEKIGYMPRYIYDLIKKEKDDSPDRILVGFSIDFRYLAIRLDEAGIKLSNVNRRASTAKTFGVRSITKEFGEGVRGNYRLVEQKDNVFYFVRLEEQP